jgi:hypothetical protein
MLCKLLSQRSPPTGKWIDSIVDCDLAILMIEPCVDIFSALLQNLLTEHHRGCRSIDEKIVLWNIIAFTHGSTTIVAEMEDSGLDTQPVDISMQYQPRSGALLPL